MDKDKRINLIIDESFVDFANEDLTFTLIHSETLEKNKHLIVVKAYPSLMEFRLEIHCSY